MSGLTAEQGCTCASVDGYRVKSRACPTHGPTMPPPRPAHEDPLRRTFTREQLAEAVEQARADIAAAMTEEMADRVEWGDGTGYINTADAARIARGEVTP